MIGRPLWTIATAATFVAGSSVSAQDTIRVRADNAPEWGLDVRLVELFSIGDVDGPPEAAFGRVVHAAAADDGSFYLYDDNDVQIRRYNARGVFQQRIGRRGGGPGEYQRVCGMFVARDNHLVVFDQALQRINHFGSDGQLLREFLHLRSADCGEFAIDANGTHYLKVRLPGPLEGAEARHQFVRLTTAGATVDSIAHPRDIRVPRSTFCIVTLDGSRCSFQVENATSG